MTVALACDQGGYPLKEDILKYLFSHNIEVLDLGTDSPVKPVDYPDYGKKCALAVRDGKVDLGIVICGTGIGISIAANKIPGIRCALAHDTYTARMAREHNDANMLALGARVLGPGSADDVLDAFLNAQFSGIDRHQKRIDKITQIEEEFLAKETAPQNATKSEVNE